MDGWVGGRMEGKAGLRIAYSNQKLIDGKGSSKQKRLENTGLEDMDIMEK